MIMYLRFSKRAEPETKLSELEEDAKQKCFSLTGLNIDSHKNMRFCEFFNQRE